MSGRRILTTGHSPCTADQLLVLPAAQGVTHGPQKFFPAAMCAGAQWWQCHRQLVADALVARRLDVRHVMSLACAPAHRLTSFARIDGQDVHYPGLL